MSWSIKTGLIIYSITLLAAYVNITILNYIASAFVGTMLLISLSLAAQALYENFSMSKPTLQIKILSLFLAVSVAVSTVHITLFSCYCINLLCGLRIPTILSMLSNRSLQLYNAASIASAMIMPATNNIYEITQNTSVIQKSELICS